MAEGSKALGGVGCDRRQLMTERSDEELAPLNVTELKLRLIHGEPGGLAGHADILRELLAHEAAVRQLVPVVVEQYRAGKLGGAPASSLVELYLKTKDASLLAALREKGALDHCNLLEKSRLFEGGVADLEDELLQFLWTSWQRVGTPERGFVVQALGKRGGPKAMERLEVIRSNLAGQVQEQRAKMAMQPPEDPASSLEEMNQRANETFLEEVRKAVRELKERQARGA